MRRGPVGAVALLFAFAIVAAACGDADETVGTTTTTGGAAAGDTTTTAAATTTTTDGDTTTTEAEVDEVAVDFCEAVPAVDTAFGGEPDPVTIGRLIDDVQASAPAELADEVATIREAVEQVLTTGDFLVLMQEDVSQAQVAINDELVARCDFTELALTGADYEYRDVPESVPAGMTALYLTNEGSEFHEAVVFQISDDTDLSFDEIMALGEEEADGLVEDRGGAFAMPGATGTGTLELTPGRYGVVCFIPVGTTPEAIQEMDPEAEPEGPPHFTQGMWAEFTVE